MVSYARMEQRFFRNPVVLILVVMEDGLVPMCFFACGQVRGVLILVVMEDGLVRN